MTNAIQEKALVVPGMFVKVKHLDPLVNRGGPETFLVTSINDQTGETSVVGFQPGETPDDQGLLTEGWLRSGTFTCQPLAPNEWPSWAGEAIDRSGLANLVTSAYAGWIGYSDYPPDFNLTLRAMRNMAVLAVEVYRLAAQVNHEGSRTAYLNGMTALDKLIGHIDGLDPEG